MNTKQKKSPLALGHNPDGLTQEQVGEGWRLLTKAEKKARERRLDSVGPSVASKHIQCWLKCCIPPRWSGGGWVGWSPDHTNRTRKPARYWLTH